MVGRRFIQIGKVVKPHGVKGELSVEYYVESPLFFASLKEVLLGEEGSLEPFGLAHWREHQGRVLLTLKGLTDRNAADALRGTGVFVPEDQLPGLEEGEVYLRDLVGLRILLPDGRELGSLVEIQTPGGQEIWVVETPEGREVLFPANEENVELDLGARRAVIHPPPGLLEIYLGTE